MLTLCALDNKCVTSEAITEVTRMARNSGKLTNLIILKLELVELKILKSHDEIKIC